MQTVCHTVKHHSEVHHSGKIVSQIDIKDVKNDQLAPSSPGGAAVRRRFRDSTPGRGTIKSTRSTQPSIPPW